MANPNEFMLENEENRSMAKAGYRSISIYDMPHPKYNSKQLPIIKRAKLSRKFFLS
jgi:hypothetical protein